MCLVLFLLVFILYGTLHFLDLTDYFLSNVREVFGYNHSGPFLFLYPSETNIMQMLVHLILSQKSLSVSVLISFHSFSLSNSVAVISTNVYLVHYNFASVILLLTPSSIFFMPVIVFSISVGLFFTFSNSLLNSSCIFTLCASTLFMIFWISFIISLNLFSDTLPIYAAFGYSSTYLPCSFVYSIFLC